MRLTAALRSGLASRGVPKAVLVDNGSAFVNTQFLRACAVLGIRLIHARPYTPTTKGKIERFFETVRGEFLVELEAPGRGRRSGRAQSPLHRLGRGRLPPPSPLRDRRTTPRPLRIPRGPALASAAPRGIPVV
ncbi:MAG TPA: hypothetical protein VNF24_07635 [Candidatus Acidoferrales bacterium]|nr:hypothetical protein [Candidatus Acidoferrales bacterium]